MSELLEIDGLETGYGRIRILHGVSLATTGSRNIGELRTRPTFVRITSAGVRESHVHDVSITKESPNYRVS